MGVAETARATRAGRAQDDAEGARRQGPRPTSDRRSGEGRRYRDRAAILQAPARPKRASQPFFPCAAVSCVSPPVKRRSVEEFGDQERNNRADRQLGSIASPRRTPLARGLAIR